MHALIGDWRMAVLDRCRKILDECVAELEPIAQIDNAQENAPADNSECPCEISLNDESKCLCPEDCCEECWNADNCDDTCLFAKRFISLPDVLLVNANGNIVGGYNLVKGRPSFTELCDVDGDDDREE
jgi:hypothetical protein